MAMADDDIDNALLNVVGGGKPIKKRKREKAREKENHSSSEDEFNDGYDEQLYGDEKDRAYLASLGEVEREEILAQRYQERQQLLRRRALARSLQGTPGSQREGRGKEGRGKEGRGKASALHDIKQRRAQASSWSRGESEEEDDDELFAPKERKKDRRTKEIEERPKSRVKSREEPVEEEDPLDVVTLADLQSICVSRSFLERTVNEPFFETLVPGLFTRLSIGAGHDGAPVYRLAEIGEVREGKTYTLGNKRTNKNLYLRIGGAARLCAMDLVSNKPLQESEVLKWRSELRKAHLPPLRKDDLPARQRQYQQARHYLYTEEDVAKLVEQRKGTGKSALAAKKTALLAQLAEKEDLGDVEGVAAITHALAQLQEEFLPETADVMWQINQRNQLANQEVRSHLDPKEVAQSLHPDLDPFSRRQTKPTNMVQYREQQRLQQDMPQESKPARAQSQESEKTSEQSEETENVVKDPEALLTAAHNFELVLDDDAEEPSLPVQPIVKPPKPLKVGGRSTLSVNEYKRRMGLL